MIDLPAYFKYKSGAQCYIRVYYKKNKMWCDFSWEGMNYSSAVDEGSSIWNEIFHQNRSRSRGWIKVTEKEFKLWKIQ